MARPTGTRSKPARLPGVIVDPTGTSDTGFTTGGSKDTLDVSQWKWVTGKVDPDKDNIANAYAAVYAEQNNLILYFGQNRALDKNGDANVGFWFLQNSVGLNGDGSFSGTHKDGDVLVQSDFTNGGSVSGVQIYKWQSGGLVLVENQAQCTGNKLGTADACAIVNTSTISTSWAGNLTSPYFFEGGLNLSALFPQSVPCFSTFLTNTRTSQSESAVLKDFALGDIDTCGSIEITKTASPADGTEFGYSTSSNLSPSTFKLTNGSTRAYDKLGPGQYSVTEDAQSGSWAFDSLSCPTASGPGTSVQIVGQAANITLGFLGNVKCTYVNKRKPQVKVVKALEPTSDQGKFNLQINGTTQAADVGNGGDTGFKEVVAGQQVTVGEIAGTGTSLANYVSSVSCDSDKGGSSTTSHSFTANFGDKVTCTITNQRKPEVKVVKALEPTNDSGKFNLLINGNVELANAGNGGDTGYKQVAVGGVTVGESAGTGTSLGNYDSKVDCGSKGSVNPGTGHAFSVAYGDRVVCTITNTRKATLTVIKHVINDNGGAKNAGNFAISVTGSNPSPASFNGAESPGTSVAIGPGAYNVSETEDPGYTASYSAGMLGEPPGRRQRDLHDHERRQGPHAHGHQERRERQRRDRCSERLHDDHQRRVGPGRRLLRGRRVTGRDEDAHLCGGVQRHGGLGRRLHADERVGRLLGDDRGRRVEDVHDHERRPAGDAHRQEGRGQRQRRHQAAAGLLVLRERWSGAVVRGRRPERPDGRRGHLLGDRAGCRWLHDELRRVLADCARPGATATCTVTNDDQAATLIVKKVVVNDDGGTATADDFSFQVNGGQAQAFELDGQNDLPVNAGTYSVTEPGVVGYASSYSNCSELVIPNGGSATCTITNDDVPATLIVKKVVVNDNGGTKQPQDFSFQVNGGQAQGFEADGQNDLEVAAGTYDVSEPAVAGYTTTYQGCADITLSLGGTATCIVTNNDVPRGQGSIDVQKSANPTTVKEPGGPVTFSVTITNTSVDVDVAIQNVVDDKFGDLDDDGGNGCFDVPINLAPGEKVNCTFSKTITGVGGTSHINTVTASGTDENGNKVSDSDDARVDITERLIDLVIVKEASSPTPLNGIVNYSLTVTNKGPDTATNVQLADPAPAGITYLTANPSQGTCNLSPSLITCSLGTIAAGQTVTIAITGRATTVGSHTNTATVTGGGGRETNPADNVDTAVTLVPAPLKPPVVKPQPEPAVCLSLTVSPKMITADGKPDKVTAKVTAAGKRVKGAKVSVKGAGVSKTARTNGKGVAVLRINPNKPGIITISVVESNQKLCGPKRIGVVGVFLPPLTG